MSSRFHNKYHRHNHHTTPVNDPRYPDSSHDPIASPESPFLGPFVLTGSLSATADTLAGVFIAPAASAIAVKTIGGIDIGGALTTTEINFTGNIVSTYSTPLIANGDFLQVTINGTPRYIRLWNFY
jgi:hypothetical protein